MFFDARDCHSARVRHLQRTVLVICAASLFAACLAGEPEESEESGKSERVAEHEAAVLAGLPDEGDPAVVALYLQDFVLCTGTLVTPTVVVTAAHCVSPETLQGHDVTELEVRIGERAWFPDQRVPIVAGAYHPDFTMLTMNLEGNPDVAVVRLASALDIEPVGLPTPDIASLLYEDAPLRIVGYGRTSFGAEDYGRKRQRDDIKVGKLTSDEISLSPAAMCAGDSGGPYLFTHEGKEYVVGVHSNGNCQTTSGGTRLDSVFADFVLPFIEQDCVADGACMALCTNVVDPDCACVEDGRCDPECPVEVGDPDCACEADDHCNAECPGMRDPDCEEDEPPAPDEQDEGCAAGSSSHASPWSALAVLALLVRRRRTI